MATLTLDGGLSLDAHNYRFAIVNYQQSDKIFLPDENSAC
jgi:hypothetical protein